MARPPMPSSSCRIVVGVAMLAVVAALVASYASGEDMPSMSVLFSDPAPKAAGSDAALAEVSPEPSTGASPGPSPGAVANRSLFDQLQFRERELTGQMSVVRSFWHDKAAFT